ncbi:MAG: NUDIX hydrolase [Gemmatimonadota bacterium]|nr:NUDIX hydrolase [Gemmatimonadota bacterium]
MGESRTLYEGRYLRICSVDGWEYVQRTRGVGAALIVAITGAREIVLVEQFRIPVNGRVIELPAGLIGDIDAADTDARAAALRELHEETGYEATDLVPLMDGPSSQGLSSEMLSLFLATGLTRTGDGGGSDEGEEIEVHVVPLAVAPAWLEARRAAGTLVDPRVYAGLFFAERS